MIDDRNLLIDKCILNMEGLLVYVRREGVIKKTKKNKKNLFYPPVKVGTTGNISWCE